MILHNIVFYNANSRKSILKSVLCLEEDLEHVQGGSWGEAKKSGRWVDLYDTSSGVFKLIVFLK